MSPSHSESREHKRQPISLASQAGMQNEEIGPFCIHFAACAFDSSLAQVKLFFEERICQACGRKY
jgi:hypothetical protein